MITRRRLAAAAAMVAGLGSSAAQAMTFEIPAPGDEIMEAVLNTSITIGAGLRMQDRSADLVGKSNLDPQVCTGTNGAYQSCQGLFKNQFFPAQRLAEAPGAASVNHDDGNLNYDRGELFSAPVKVVTDLTLSLGDFGFFGKILYFYDAVNADFREFHPNRITADNYLQVGRDTPVVPLSPVGLPELLANPYSLFNGLIAARPWGQRGTDGRRISYGAGSVVRNKRRDGEVLRQIGTDLQFLESVLYGSLPMGDDHGLTFKLGRQIVNWGESTTLVLNSISQANPVNANNFYRVGRTVDEVFTPVGMVFASFEPFDNATLEAFYQLEWKGIEAPAPGSYFSDLDIGTDNAIGSVNISPGGVAEDPDRKGSPLDSPLTGVTNSTSTILRLQDRTPDAGGQFGVALKHYFESVGSGIEAGLYFINYHSRLPLGSFYSARASCARREGNDLGIDANDLVTFLATCPDIPFVHALLNPQQPEAQHASDSVAALDSPRFQIEYPENIRLFGLSFNTTVGDYSIQGEVAYRPNMPLQIDVQDLGFAALGPTLTRCHDASLGCLGSAEIANLGIGYAEDGNATNHGSSDFTDASGRNPYPDVINVGIGHVPGSARAFPSFVTAYRGGTVGENPPCSAAMTASDFRRDADCYIRGYERLEVYQFNFGTTRVLGPPENPFGADQIIIATEWGATWVADLPPLNELQFEAPGTNYHASAGADGSGADGSRQACSLNPACTFGPDGIRFNPHQEEPEGFADAWSWGYRVLAFASYESVLPRISLRPFIIWAHDVRGTSPGPGGSFVQGRKQADVLLETRYGAALSFTLGYTWFTGGGRYNLLRDRDYLQIFARYQF